MQAGSLLLIHSIMLLSVICTDIFQTLGNSRIYLFFYHFKLDDADKVIYGSSDPGYLMGLNNTIRYKNFDFNIYFYGQFNVLNAGSYKDLWLTGADGMTGIVNMYRGYNMPTSAAEVWTHDNQSASRRLKRHCRAFVFMQISIIRLLLLRMTVSTLRQIILFGHILTYEALA